MTGSFLPMESRYCEVLFASRATHSGWPCSVLSGVESNGVGEIRTHEGLSPLAVFKTAAFNHSATTPGG
jgi:hypothetical protein